MPTTSVPSLLAAATLMLVASGCTGGPETASCPFAPQAVTDPNGPLLQLASDDGRVCIRLDRPDLSEPDFVYKSVPWRLDHVTAARTGSQWDVADDAHLHGGPVDPPQLGRLGHRGGRRDAPAL